MTIAGSEGGVCGIECFQKIASVEFMVFAHAIRANPSDKESLCNLKLNEKSIKA